ncbi:MAG: PAC2 family protein [Nitrososphaerota archaeon]
MNKTYVNILSYPRLKKPTLIVGLPEIGNIGEIVARLLIEFSHAELFAEIYSPSFPDLVNIDKKGLCRPPRYESYASGDSENLIILTGDAQPPLEDIPAHYEVCGEVLNLARKFGCRFVITVAGVPSEHPQKEVYVAATSKRLAAEYLEKDAVIYKGGRIFGVSGLLLGLAKIRGLEGVCLLAPTLGLTADQEAAFNVYRFLRKVLGTPIKEGL